MGLTKRTGFARIIAALGYSLDGLAAAVKSEAAFRQELLLVVVLAAVACGIEVTPVERAMLLGVLILVLIVELINTAIEKAIDRISGDLHPLSKQAKDMGSAAVLLALLLVAITWGLVLLG